MVLASLTILLENIQQSWVFFLYIALGKSVLQFQKEKVFLLKCYFIPQYFLLQIKGE